MYTDTKVAAEAAYPPPSFEPQAAKGGILPAKLVLFSDNFDLSTWLLIGAVCQIVLSSTIHPLLAAIPAVLILIIRSSVTLLRTLGWMENHRTKGVIFGRSSAQFPTVDGKIDHDSPSAKPIVLFILTMRSSHPLGRLAPGFAELQYFFKSNWEAARASRSSFGYLGKTPTLVAIEDRSANTFVWISYWRSLEELHAFAHSDSHMAGWNWSVAASKTHPHIGLTHETYEVPAGNWENVGYNARAFGMGNLRHLVTDPKDGTEQKLISGLAPIKNEVKWNSWMGRMGRPAGVEGLRMSV